MSFSKGGFEGLRNPCKLWIEYSGSEGTFHYYNKDEKKNVDIKLDYFIVLDDSMFTISGYSEKLNTGVYANEVRDLESEIIVKYTHNKKQVELTKGKYQDIKEEVSNLKGPGYTKSVYILAFIDDEYVLANVKCKGSILTSWIEFCKKARSSFGSNAVIITGTEVKEKKDNKGKVITSWYEPVFELGDKLSSQEIREATEQDTILQKYLTEYLKLGGPNEVNVDPVYNPEDESQEVYDNAPTFHEEDQEWNNEREREREEERAESRDNPPEEEGGFDTDDWADYKPKNPKYPNLGKCSIAQLEEMKEQLEPDYVDEKVYHLIIRGIAEKMKEKKGKKAPPF